MRGNVSYDVPSTAETIGVFFMDILLFFLLAWYFDHIDNSNRGKSYGYFFFLEKNYWCPQKKLASKRASSINSNPDLKEISMQIEQTEKLLDGNNQRISRHSCKINNTINDSIASFDSDEDSKEIGINSVLGEKLKILRSEHNKEEFEGLRILGCAKTYKIANQCCGTRDVKALKDVNINLLIKRGNFLF